MSAAGQWDVLQQAIIDGKTAAVEGEVRRLLEAGAAPESIINEGMIPAMIKVGELFEEGQFFVPEMLISARAMRAGLAIVKPLLRSTEKVTKAKVVLGTIQGDLHDIGKNLVGMMLEGAGYEVIDLGTDVPPDKFVQTAKEQQASLIGVSALLTTTMIRMQDVVRSVEQAGLKGKVAVLVGGAPVNERFAKEIGADGYAPNASAAVRVADSLLGKLKGA